MVDVFDQRGAFRIDLRLVDFHIRYGRFALQRYQQTILVLVGSFILAFVLQWLSFFFTLNHSEFLIAVLVEIISTEGQGTLNLCPPLIDDLKITQLAFDLLCYLMLFRSITEQKSSSTLLNWVAPTTPQSMFNTVSFRKFAKFTYAMLRCTCVEFK